jgi:fused-like protein
MISRLSKDYYEHIDSIEPYEDIKRLISHPDPQIRSRVINLIGNMCRHSNFFYKKLNSFGILRHCITLCED